jgi:hypothetical protein
MGEAQRGVDALAFYAADLGLTRAISCSIASAQLPDKDGALVPGRYVLHISDVVPTSKKIWVRTGKFEKGSALSITAGIPWFPMQLGGIVAFEFNVLKDYSDQVAAIMAGPGNPSAILYVTRISRDA